MEKGRVAAAQKNESSLIARARQGDAQAFEALVRTHSGRVLNLAWQMLGSREKAWDASQEAFLLAWKGIQRFRGEAGFATWIHRIAVNVCLRELGRGGSQAHVISLDQPLAVSREDNEEAGTLGDILALPAKEGSDPEVTLVQKELQQALSHSLKALPSHYRVTFWLREMEGLSYREIAHVLSIREGTVKSRLNTVRKLLRERLETEVVR